MQLLKFFDWRWVGIVYAAGSYSDDGTAHFVRESKKAGICVEYRLRFTKSSGKQFTAIVKALRESSSRVVLLFMSLSKTKSFLKEMENYNITDKQWLGSESWITQVDLASAKRQHILQGTIGFALPQTAIPGLADFLLSLKPSDEPQSYILKAMWEDFFNCSFSPSNTSATCTGTEDLRTVTNDYTDVTHFRAENNVYKAVYLVAYALHGLLQCENGSNPSTGKPCVNKKEVQPKLVSAGAKKKGMVSCTSSFPCMLFFLKVLEHIKYVNFTTKYGSKVFFDENKNSIAQYDLVNWQMREDGSVDIVTIGQYDTSFKGEELKVAEDTKIVWGGTYKKVKSALPERLKVRHFLVNAFKR